MGDTNQSQTKAANDISDVNIFEHLPPSTVQTPVTATMPRSFNKILLKETDNLLLLESNCYTVLRDATNNSRQKNDAERYEDSAMGRKTLRRTNNVETQTNDSHFKTRLINTIHIENSATGAFVSNYDMHDTYKNLERTTKAVQIDFDDHREQLDITTYTNSDFNDLSSESEAGYSFQLASIILQRILAGNIFHEKQKRFRNMGQSKPLDDVVHYLYRIKLLCKYRHYETLNAVSCLSWNPRNTDILAIGYGAFKNQSCKERNRSAVCVWNIKVNIFFLYCTCPYFIISFQQKGNHILNPLYRIQ